MKKTTLFLTVIRANDLEASLAFYQSLGVWFVSEQHGSGPVHYSCDFGDVVLELYSAKKSEAEESSTRTTMLGFNVESLDDTLTKLNVLGIESQTPPKTSAWGRWVNVLDPNDRTVQITEPIG